MNQALLHYLCDPIDKSKLMLRDAVVSSDGRIESGVLVSDGGRRYPIRGGVPRFVDGDTALAATVKSFGDEWNYFNFDDFKQNWLGHTVQNTFGSISFFRDKIVVDCGGGSGMQSKWIAEAGAKHVISLELSHSVDDVMKRNLQGLPNVDIVQCSIDRPPLRSESIDGIVICHNVIQHTPAVERTAHALWDTVAKGGEFVFNCYPMNDLGVIRRVRVRFHALLRRILSRRSFSTILLYSRVMSLLRFTPLLGWVLEKTGLVVRGSVVPGPRWVHRAYKAAVLNTFDCYGSHSYQHLKTDEEIRRLVGELQPNEAKVLNLQQYFSRPQPIGIALRLIRD